jgi:NitT/TauT family transport system substrate-binding protein
MGAAALLLTCVAGSCTEDSPAPRRPLHIAHELWAGYFPLDAASVDSSSPDLLQVTLIEDSADLYARFAGGAFDGIAASLVDLLLLKQSVPDLRIVGCTDESAGADAVVTRAGLPGTGTLAGRRIGVAIGTFAELLVLEMLARAGLTRDDVELVQAPAARVPELLRRGEIDAGQTWEPYLSTLPRDSFPSLFSTRDTPGLIIQCVAFRSRVLDERPEQVRELLSALVTLGDRLVRDPERLRLQAALALGRELSAVPAIQGIRWLSLEENRRLLGADGQSPRLDSLAGPLLQFLAGSGALRVQPAVAAMVRPDLLPR